MRKSCRRIVEKDALFYEHPEESRRKLAHKEDVMFGCDGTKEELSQCEMELPCVSKEDV